MGKVTDFKGAVKAEQGEPIVFSWIEGKLMIFGGFEILLDTER